MDCAIKTQSPCLYASLLLDNSYICCKINIWSMRESCGIFPRFCVKQSYLFKFPYQFFFANKNCFVNVEYRCKTHSVWFHYTSAHWFNVNKSCLKQSGSEYLLPKRGFLMMEMYYLGDAAWRMCKNFVTDWINTALPQFKTLKSGKRRRLCYVPDEELRIVFLYKPAVQKKQDRTHVFDYNAIHYNMKGVCLLWMVPGENPYL